MGLLKFQNSFPSAQYHINDYDGRGRRSRDKNCDQIIQFLRKRIIYKT